MPDRNPIHRKFSVFVVGLFLTGCSISRPMSPLEPPPKAVSQAQTPLIPSTPVTLWASPDLPHDFLATLDERLLQESGFQLVQDADQALLQVAPGGDKPLSTWVYALVAPFPTIADGLTLEALRSIWTGEGDESETWLFVGTNTLSQLESLFGPKGENVRAVPEEALVDVVWTQGNALAIIPFETLEPRWKVLALDGQSPIMQGFNLDTYPLKLNISIAGREQDYERLLSALPIPRSNYDPQQMTVLIMTGVTALTRATAWQMDRRGVAYPAEKIGDWLGNADITHISNEVVFADDCPTPDPQQEGLKFCSDPANIELLEIVGTDIIELTGNHVRDYGSDALLETLDAYHVRGWGTFGGGVDLEAAFEPHIVEHNGNRLAFLGCNYAGPKYAWATESGPGSTPCDLERLYERVASLKSQGYLVVFTFQWAERSVVLQDQREAFEAAVEAGATIVSGSQAHQPLGMAFYQDGFMHFGLGNLFFDQMQNLNVRSELIDRHVFYDGRHISTELLAALLESYAQPRPMTEDERELLLGEIFEDSGW